MLKATYKKYVDIIKRPSKTWSKNEIHSFKNMLNRKHCASDENRDKINKLDNMFYDMMLKKDYLCITKEHSDQGISYLTKLAFKPNGKTRNTKDYPFTQGQIEILRNFKKFTFVSFTWSSEFDRDYRHYDEACIVYRVHSKNGDYFDYVPVHWSQPIILKDDGCGYYYKQGLVAPKLITSSDDIFSSPCLDEDDVSPQYKVLEELFCDSSGFGSSSERALTVEQLTAKIDNRRIEYGDNLYSAITNQGQFQVYITLYTKAA